MRLDDYPGTLTRQEENDIAVAKTDDALQQLVMCNMREALLYSKRCSYGRLTDGDLISVCYLGLADAAKNFSPNKIRFFGYAKPYIRGRIFAEFRGLRVVKKSETTAYAMVPEPLTEDETSSDSIPNAGRCDDYQPMSPESENFDFELTQFKEEWSLIEPLVKGILSDKERMVLELRYISGFNFRQIGDLFAIPVSRSHVQHIHGVALKKIKEEVAKRKITSHCSSE